MVFLTPCLKMRFQKNRTMVLKTVYCGIKVQLLYIILYRHQEKPWYHYVHSKYLTKRKDCAGGVFFLYQLTFILKNKTKYKSLLI